MAAIRFTALANAYNREAKPFESPKCLFQNILASMYSTRRKCRSISHEEAYEHVLEAIEKGTRIDRKIADQIASGMKAWAIEMGATHYTHWFQPLTEGTAEKHDAFIDFTG